MAKSKKGTPKDSGFVPGYAICYIHADCVGWAIGGGSDGLDVRTWPTREEAEKEMRRMKRVQWWYAYKDPMEVRWFDGFPVRSIKELSPNG